MSLLLQLLPLNQAPRNRAWLDAAEQARLDGFKSPERAAQFLAGHCLARQLACVLAGGEPPEWSLRVAGDGRRWLDHARLPTLALSLSHAGPSVLAGVGTRPLGVDIEPAGQARDWIALARTMLSVPEAAAVLAAAESDRAGVFLQAWTLKEAWAKRSGRGLQRTQARRCTAEPCAAAVAEAWTWRHADGSTLALAAWPGAELRRLGVAADAVAWRYVESA